ncbi:hypothetical protein HOG21_06080 [bacterium]|jgi:hypothetical protein|nr:hypothetical protein [bacterium]
MTEESKIVEEALAAEAEEFQGTVLEEPNYIENVAAELGFNNSQVSIVIEFIAE